MTSTMMDDLKRTYHRAWWALVLRGLLALAVGVFVLARPLESVAAFALVIAWWALLPGAVEVVHAIELRPLVKNWMAPPATLTAIMGLVAGLGIFSGAALIAAAIGVRSLLHR